MSKTKKSSSFFSQLCTSNSKSEVAQAREIMTAMKQHMEDNEGKSDSQRGDQQDPLMLLFQLKALSTSNTSKDGQIIKSLHSIKDNTQKKRIVGLVIEMLLDKVFEEIDSIAEFQSPSPVKETLMDQRSETELQIISFTLPQSNSSHIIHRQTQDSNVYKLPQMVPLFQQVDIEKTVFSGCQSLQYKFEETISHQIDEKLLPVILSQKVDQRNSQNERVNVDKKGDSDFYNNSWKCAPKSPQQIQPKAQTKQYKQKQAKSSNKVGKSDVKMKLLNVNQQDQQKDQPTLTPRFGEKSAPRLRSKKNRSTQFQTQRGENSDQKLEINFHSNEVIGEKSQTFEEQDTCNQLPNKLVSPKKTIQAWDSVSDNAVVDTTETGGNTEAGLTSINDTSFYTQQIQSIGGLTAFVDNTQREMLDVSTGFVSIVKKMKSRNMITPVSKRKELLMSSLTKSNKRTKASSFIDNSSPGNYAILKQVQKEELKKKKIANVDMWDWKA